MLKLGQITGKDWLKSSFGRYEMQWKSSVKAIEIFILAVSDYRQSIFRYAQSYYRWFMKNAHELKAEMPKAEIIENDFD
jgi:hypothetical protein